MQAKKKNDMIQNLLFLSMQMENSERELINAIVPNTMQECNCPAKRSASRWRDETEKQIFSPQIVEEVVQLNKSVAKYLGITPLQAVLFVPAFTFDLNRESFDVDDICKFFDIRPIEFLQLQNDFDELVQKRIFLLEKDDLPFGKRKNYVVNSLVKDAIVSGQKLDHASLEAPNIDRYQFVSNVSNIIESRCNGDICTRQLFKNVSPLEEQHKKLSFVKNFLKLNLSLEERTLFYEICDDFITQRERSTGINCTLTDIYDNVKKRMEVARVLKQEQHALQKAELIEVVSQEMFSDALIVLTDKGKQLFLEEDYDLFSTETNRNQQLIYPDKIVEKQLFYDDELQQQLRLLINNLGEEKFSAMQQRLKNLGMPKGVATLFYGLPGTGKTETAMQIAKATGRAVCHVDISAAKTCWYGESQKRVKAIFTEYRKMCEKEKLKPILLFNEADALFSSRQDINKSHGSSSVAQTENAIQNIILEEMENLDGILIATTNLTENFDSAFARRFLFKISFGKPSIEARKSIWQSKLDGLSDADCRYLAQKFDFSGGEIDNIVRKVVMSEVLDGTKPDLAAIEKLCQHEKLGTQSRQKIGFTN